MTREAVRLAAETHLPVTEKPKGWPEKCSSCGAPWTQIGFDYGLGFCCLACGRCDGDE